MVYYHVQGPYAALRTGKGERELWTQRDLVLGTRLIELTWETKVNYLFVTVVRVVGETEVNFKCLDG